jgi:hypothetical protein
MKTLENQIASAAKWLLGAAENLPHGEAGVKLILHNGQIARVERLVVEKTQASAQSTESGLLDD